MFWQSPEKKLYAAIEKGKDTKVKKYLTKCDKNIVNDDGWSPLHAACYHGHVEIAKYLTTQFDVDQKDNIGRTALYLASETGRYDVIKILVAGNIKADIVKEGGMSPMHVACWKGHLKVVKLLIEHCNPNLKASLGSTPLDMAASQGKLEIVRYLVMKKVDVQAVNKDGWNALHSASWWGRVDVVRFLMQHCDINQTTNAGNTAFDLAIEHGKRDVVLLFREKEESKLSVFDAARLGYVHLVRKFAMTSDIHAPNENGWTAMHIACSNGQIDVVRVLMNYMDVNVRTKEGATPIYVAAGNGQLEIVKLLISHRATVSLAHNSGWTPLHIACSKGHLAVAKYVLEFIPINTQTRHGSTALHLSATYGKLEVVKFLIANSADTTAVDNNGWSALHDACSNGYIDVVDFLIKSHDVNLRNNNGQTPLYQAAQNGKLEVVKFLLDKNAHVGAVSNNGWTPLHDACSNGHLEVVKVLSKYIDINTQTKDGATPLYVAAGKGRLAILNYLLGNNADVKLASKIGWTPLHSASYNGHVEVVQVLSKLISLNAMTKAETTPLYVAAGNGKIDVVRYLLSQDVSFSDKNGSTPLHRAAANGHLDVVRELLSSSNVDVNVRTRDGQTALHKAAQHGRVDVVKCLLSQNINYEIVSHTGWSPFHSACWGGHMDVVRLLVDDIDVDVQTDEGATPLYIASGNNHIELCNYLMAKNANVILPTNIGWSPLHVACNLGHYDVALNITEYVNPRLLGSIRWCTSKQAFQNGHDELREAMTSKIQSILSMKRNVVERFHMLSKQPEDEEEWERVSEVTTEGTMYSLDDDGFL